MTLDLNFNQTKPVRCVNCLQTKGEHKAGTLNCPVGMRTRIGFISYQESVFTKKHEAPMDAEGNRTYRGWSIRRVESRNMCRTLGFMGFGPNGEVLGTPLNPIRMGKLKKQIDYTFEV